MTEYETNQLAETVSEKLANLTTKEIRPWLDGFVSTHPMEQVQSVNRLIKEDPRYMDATIRAGGWRENDPNTRVSWLHVSPEAEATLRAAASWRSSPWRSRELYDKAMTFSTWSFYLSETLNLPMETRQARDASALYGDRVALNPRGVALEVANDPASWPDEVADLVATCRPQHSRWLVLCPDGRIAEGLRTWPRS